MLLARPSAFANSGTGQSAIPDGCASRADPTPSPVCSSHEPITSRGSVTDEPSGSPESSRRRVSWRSIVTPKPATFGSETYRSLMLPKDFWPAGDNTGHKTSLRVANGTHVSDCGPAYAHGTTCDQLGRLASPFHTRNDGCDGFSLLRRRRARRVDKRLKKGRKRHMRHKRRIKPFLIFVRATILALHLNH